MIIGIPTEVKVAEKRVAVTPSGVRTLVQGKHEVLLQSGAGLGSGFSDESYMQAGARMEPTSEEVWKKSDMIIKVKEPLPGEYDLMRQDQILFTYLHLAAGKTLAEKLVEKKVVGIAYETIQTANGALPYVLQIANIGYEKAMKENPAIAKGMNVIKGEVVHKAVAESVGLPYVPLT